MADVAPVVCGTCRLPLSGFSCSGIITHLARCRGRDVLQSSASSSEHGDSMDERADAAVDDDIAVAAASPHAGASNVGVCVA